MVVPPARLGLATSRRLRSNPQVPGGTCAVAAQQYFRVGGTWNTRLARVGTCQPPVLVPDVLNDSLPEASQVVAAASLTVGWLMMDWNKEASALYQSIGAEIEPGTTFCRIRDDALRALAT